MTDEMYGYSDVALVIVCDWLETVRYDGHLVALGVRQAGWGISVRGQLSGQFNGTMFWKWTTIDTGWNLTQFYLVLVYFFDKISLVDA